MFYTYNNGELGETTSAYQWLIVLSSDLRFLLFIPIKVEEMLTYMLIFISLITSNACIIFIGLPATLSSFNDL